MHGYKDSDQDEMESRIDESEPMTVAELSELTSIAESEPFLTTVTLHDWESKVEAQEHISEYGDMTAEDYRAKAAFEAQMRASVWAGRAR